MKIKVVKRIVTKSGNIKYYVRCGDKKYTCYFGDPCCCNYYTVVEGYTTPTSVGHKNITNTLLGIEIHLRCNHYENFFKMACK